MKQVKWGIIGLGAIASQFANGFNNLTNAKLLGIASNNNEKIKKFKDNYKINEDYCFNNYEDIIKNQDIDIIYIALPTSLHFEWIIKCLNAKKKVLVEKPATINSEQSINIKNNFLRKDLLFTEGFMYLYHPKIRKILEIIKSDEIGELISMESVFGYNFLSKKNFFGFEKKKKIDPKNRLFNQKLGGGAILDLGCYPVSFSTLVASLKSNINYDRIKIFNKKKEIYSTNVDIDSYAELKFENNFVSKIAASFKKNLGKKTKILGTKGELIIEDTWTSDSSNIIINIDNKDKVISISENQNIYSYEIESISQCIIQKKTKVDFPGLTIDQTIGNMKIIDKWLS